MRRRIWPARTADTRPGDFVYDEATKTLTIDDVRLTTSYGLHIPRHVSRRFSNALDRFAELDAEVGGICLHLDKDHADVARLFTGPLTFPHQSLEVRFSFGVVRSIEVCLEPSLGLYWETDITPWDARYPHSTPVDPAIFARLFDEFMEPDVEIEIRGDRSDYVVLNRLVGKRWMWNHAATGFVLRGPLAEKRSMCAALAEAFPLATPTVGRVDHAGGRLTAEGALRWPAVSATILALMLAVDLPPYVVLEIIDCLPGYYLHTRMRKVTYIEAILTSKRKR